LRINAPQLLKLGIIDEIVPEPPGGAHRDYQVAAENLKKALLKHLTELKKIPKNKIAEKRHEKFRQMGPIKE